MRITEKVDNTRQWKDNKTKVSELKRPKQNKTSIEAQANTARMGETESKTLSWQPSCSCGADTVPGIVLDCFMGSGTTALVALKLGRKYLGIELNPEYIKIAEKRLKEMELFNEL